VRMLRPFSVAVLAAAVAVGGCATAPAAPAALAASASASAASTVSAVPHRTLVPEVFPPAVHSPRPTSPGGPRPAAIPPNPTFDNWSGYEVNGYVGEYTSVTSNWVQPYVNCASDQAVGFWVGLDGEQGPANPTVEQTGTAVSCSGGSASYYAWYEMYPNNPVEYGNGVAPGDNLTATVTADANGQYTLYLRDITQGWAENSVVSPPEATQNSSAEIVVEAPGNTSPAIAY
jgi:Peptidase A4 family